MKFKIAPEIFQSFPSLVLGLVIADNLKNSSSSESVQSMLKAEMAEVVKRVGATPLKELPIVAAWHEVYKSFGANPKEYRPSIETLIRMSQKGASLSGINTAVDLYNLVSLKHMLPAGADDLDKVEGGLELRKARGHERFVQLGSGAISSPEAGEVVYCDENDVLCRRWNWRESDKTKITESSRRICFVVEGIPPSSPEIVRAACEDIEVLMSEYCQASCRTVLLDAAGAGEAEL